jgi:elongation factor 1 alpha-like protein
VSSGDKLLLMPLNEICSVKGIRLHFEQSEFAAAGDNAEIGLTGIEPSHVKYATLHPLN